MAGDGFRTPLGRARGLGSARDGTGHFVRQRLTAIANLPLAVAFVVIVIALSGDGHQAVVSTLAHPLVAAIMLAAIVSVAVHMRIGMQVIIEDYVHGDFLRLACLAANALFAWAVAILSALALLKMAFGG